jgi:hypothetical protein
MGQAVHTAVAAAKEAQSQLQDLSHRLKKAEELAGPASSAAKAYAAALQVGVEALKERRREDGKRAVAQRQRQRESKETREKQARETKTVLASIVDRSSSVASCLFVHVLHRETRGTRT